MLWCLWSIRGFCNSPPDHLGPGAHAGRGLPGWRPLGVVVRDGGEDVRVDHQAVAGQAPAQHLDELAVDRVC